MLAGLLGDPERRESWPLYAALSPHVRAAAAHAFRLAGLLDEVSIPIWTGLLARTGRYLLSAGDLRAAADALDRALELRTATTDPDTIAEVRADRVEVSRLLGRLAEARGRLEEWPEGAVDVAGLRDLALGTVLRDQGDLVAAREALRRVLTKLPPDGRWRRLASRCERELAVVVRLSGDDGARGLVERALEGHQRVLGSRHDEVGRDLRELGVVLREAAELDDARRTLEQALWVHRSLLGGGHHDIGRDLCELAAAVAEMGEREQARSLLDESLAILSGAFGEAHPEVARARRWLAVVTRADGDLAVAASMLHQVLAVLEAALGPVHPEVAQTLVEQARTLREMGDLAGARRAYQRALSIWDSVLGPGNPVSSAVSAETEVLSAVVRQEGRTT